MRWVFLVGYVAFLFGCFESRIQLGARVRLLILRLLASTAIVTGVHAITSGVWL